MILKKSYNKTKTLQYNSPYSHLLFTENKSVIAIGMQMTNIRISEIHRFIKKLEFFFKFLFIKYTNITSKLARKPTRNKVPKNIVNRDFCKYGNEWLYELF